MSASDTRKPASRDWATVKILGAICLEGDTLVWRERDSTEFPDASYATAWNGLNAGNPVAIKLGSNGYFAVRFHGRWFAAHRLIWALTFGCWPKGDLDHINGDRTDNRLENLRDVSRQENARNAKLRKDNRSGCVGVRQNKSRNNKWIAEITVDGRRQQVGTFVEKDAAILARQIASEAHGYSARHGRAA